MAKYTIAIVGAGPSGYFAAQALQNLETDDLKFSIDLIERLPTPWGLVRSGVAPDHPKIKSVSKVFEKVATAGNVSLFGNVEVGKDISIDTLTEKYDAVVIATGTSIGRKLGIPGEELTNSLSSAEFVPWYNGHPDFAELNPDLNCDTAVVIGAGNVAMDCARLLAVDPSELEPTDTAAHAIEAFKNSKIRHVYICARRGAEHAARLLAGFSGTLQVDGSIQAGKSISVRPFQAEPPRRARRARFSCGSSIRCSVTWASPN